MGKMIAYSSSSDLAQSTILALLLMALGVCQAEPLRVGLESQDYLPYYRALPGKPAEGYAIALLYGRSDQWCLFFQPDKRDFAFLIHS